MHRLGRAWRVILSNGRASQSRDTRREIEKFAESAEANLTKLQRQLNRNSFKFLPAKGVAIPKKGKNAVRPIVVAPVESRIVQRALLDVLIDIPKVRTYAENPYSFGGVKKRTGTEDTAVPAAIAAVVRAIGGGAEHIIRSDIESFFARIPKPRVVSLLESEVRDSDFLEFFSKAIHVELENLSALKSLAEAFPTHEIGVAQGNSLSPLLGNILLSEFDRKMNEDGSTCIRYIDDFIILSPTQVAAEAKFSQGLQILRGLGLQAAANKTFRGTATRGFAFLGIEIQNGAIRPSQESRQRFMKNISDAFDSSSSEFLSIGGRAGFLSSDSLIRTLSDVRGIVSGWSHHYAFCNEKNVLSQLDADIDSLIRNYFGIYKRARETADVAGRRRLLGIPLLSETPRRQPSADAVSTSASMSARAHVDAGLPRCTEAVPES